MTESEASRAGAVASAASTFLPRKLRVSLLSNVYLLAGRYKGALARAEQALELAHRYHEKGSAAWALYMLAASEGASGSSLKRGGPLQVYLEALQAAETLGMRPLSAHCHLGLGRHLALSAAGRAREHLKRARELYSEMDMQSWLKMTQSALKELEAR
jgi:tetratricopeptide (TPR) repeat protein